MTRRPQRLLSTLACLPAAAIAVWCVAAAAEEPAEQFLQQLKQRRMFDTAELYLDYLQQHDLLPASMKRDFELEKLAVRQQAAASNDSATKRQEQSASVREGLEAFLSQNSDHPRRGEVRVQLAESFIVEGLEAKQAADRAADAAAKLASLATARGAFGKAEKLFLDGIEDMAGEIRSLQGAGATDAEQTQRRERLQTDYRKSQILVGQARKLAAETHPEASPEFKAAMQKARDQFDEVSEKASRTREPGTYFLATLYRGQSQAALGEVEPAVESLLRVADQPGGGVLRDLKVKATTSLVRLLSRPEVAKYEAAGQRADDLLRSQQGTEKESADWLDLQLAAVQAKLAQADALAAAPATESQARSIRRDAQGELQKLTRSPGAAGDEARRLLAGLGVEARPQRTAPPPKVRTFAEANEAAESLLQQINQDELTLKILQSQGGGNAAVEKQTADLQAGIVTARSQAIDLLRIANELFNLQTDAREDLAKIRLRLAYLLYTADRHPEAAATADLVARTNRGSDVGKDAATIAIASLHKLVVDSQGEHRPTESLRRMAEYTLANWPESQAAESAAQLRLQLALTDRRWEDAEAAIAKLAGDPAKIAVQQRDLGYILYTEMLRAEAAKGSAADGSSAGVESPAADEKTAVDEADSLRDRAEKLLVAGLAPLDAASLDARGVEAGVALASIYARTGRLDRAAEVLRREAVGPLAAVEAGSAEVRPAVKMDALRVALQLEVAKSTNGGGAVDAAAVEKLVGRMQELAAANPEDKSLLTNALIVLANDLRTQMAAGPAAQKQKLGEGVAVLLGQLIDVSKDPATLQGAAGTLLELSRGLTDDPAMFSLSQSMAAAAAKGFEKLAALDAATLEKIGRKPDEVRRLLASAQSAAGQYAAANELYVATLKANNVDLLAQIEAATNLQAWGESARDAEKLNQAMFGAAADAKNKKVIWGWQRLSELTASRPDLSKYFFDARYALAASSAAAGRIEQDPAKKTRLLEQAIKAVRATYVNFPELGDAQTKQRFDDLTRRVQKELDPAAPNTGLKAFDP